jgi:Transglycosylase SLT domain
VHVRSIIASGGRSLALLLLAAGSVAGQATAGPVDDLCAAPAIQAERAEGIPPGLVHAVALAESGRWFAADRATRPWPWTITAGPDSFFLSSMQEAVRKVQALRTEGRSNIDVGCMQINLGYHGHAFGSVAEALEPAANVAYAAQFLKRLREETRSWARATARYHSNHPERGQAYRDKVYRFWHEVRRGRLLERAPTRLAGTPPIADARPALLAPPGGGRLIVPKPPDLAREAVPGGIPILRGGIATLRPR